MVLGPIHGALDGALFGMMVLSGAFSGVGLRVSGWGFLWLRVRVGLCLAFVWPAERCSYCFLLAVGKKGIYSFKHLYMHLYAIFLHSLLTPM